MPRACAAASARAAKRIAAANTERRNVTPSGRRARERVHCTAPPNWTESEPAIIARGAGSAGRRAPRATCAGLDMASNIAAALRAPLHPLRCRADGDVRSHLGRGSAPARGATRAPGGRQPDLPGDRPPQPAHAVQPRAGGLRGRADRDGPARGSALRRRAGRQLGHRHRPGGAGEAGARPPGVARGAARARPARRRASARSTSTTSSPATRSCCARETRSWPTAGCSRPAVCRSTSRSSRASPIRTPGAPATACSRDPSASPAAAPTRPSASGADAYANELTGVAREDRRELSPLQLSINRLLRIMVALMIPISALLLYALHVHDVPTREAVSTAVAGIVSLVPEGLVLLASLVFAVAAARVGRRGALVQRLPAVEALAGLDIVCLDKTGTLTDGTLAVEEILPVSGADEREVHALLGMFAASLGSRNPTADALHAQLGGAPEPVSLEVPFSSRWKWSGIALRRRRRARAGSARGDRATPSSDAALAHEVVGPAGSTTARAAVRAHVRPRRARGRRGAPAPATHAARARRAERAHAPGRGHHRRLPAPHGRRTSRSSRRRAGDGGGSRARRGHRHRRARDDRRRAPAGAGALRRSAIDNAVFARVAARAQAPARGGAAPRRPARRDDRRRRQRRARAQGVRCRGRARLGQPARQGRRRRRARERELRVDPVRDRGGAQDPAQRPARGQAVRREVRVRRGAHPDGRRRRRLLSRSCRASSRSRRPSPSASRPSSSRSPPRRRRHPSRSCATWPRSRFRRGSCSASPSCSGTGSCTPRSAARRPSRRRRR